MGVYGDLATLDLADLLQNIEAHRRSGTLRIRGERGESALYLLEGQVSMLASDERESVLEALISRGHVEEAALVRAERKQKDWAQDKTVGELLVQQGTLRPDELDELCRQALFEDVCDLLSRADGEFEFIEGRPPATTFDADERRLQLRLPVSSIVLEAARRTDHWAMIREVLPADDVHLAVDPQLDLSECEATELVTAMLSVLDGSRSVTELMSEFPGQRFTVYEVLADLIRDGIVRELTLDEMLDRARSLCADHPDRALRIVQKALTTAPDHEGLLELEAELARHAGDPGRAAAAHQSLAELKRAQGRSDDVIQQLERARRLTPAEPSPRERLLELALEQNDVEDAIDQCIALVDLLRASGEPDRALAALEQVLVEAPDSVVLLREHARICVAVGRTEEALENLLELGRRLIARERFPEACLAFQEVLRFEPEHAEARGALDSLEDQVHRSRSRRQQNRVRRMVLATISGLVLGALGIEVVSRLALLSAQRSISRRALIEERRYDEASEALREVTELFPWSSSALVDVPHLLEEWEDRADRVKEEGGAPHIWDLEQR